ncbi:MAG TPA: DUF4058 family protein, partial [Humisphaera sp.]|nr:DUF4058 family protein [Humisphaera sp.]
MASPFPGMDPFLERHWFDLHAQLVTLAGTALNKSLPDDLVARVDERVAADKQIDPRIFDAEERTERYIAVTQVEGGELVTVLEVFSAATKLPGEDRERYLQRRAAWLASGANVVEV